MSIFDLLLVSFSCLGRGGGVRRSLRWICLFVLGDFVVGGGGGGGSSLSSMELFVCVRWQVS